MPAARLDAKTLGAATGLGSPDLAYVCTIRADIGPAVEFATSLGTVRSIFPIVGGSVAGPGIAGHIIPGGADFAQRLPNGAYVIEARYCIALDDGTTLMITNAGRMQPMADGSFQGRTRAVIEAPAGPWGWLTDSVLFGTIWAEPGDEERVFIQLWEATIQGPMAS